MRNASRFAAFFLCFALSPLSASAVTVYVGDKDSFGFSDVSQYLGPDGNAADANGNGVLDSGDSLPDLNRNRSVGSLSGDDFDNRSTSEATGQNGEIWTDVSLSTSFWSRPGLAKDASFTFHFDVPAQSDPDYGKEHFVNFVYADYDVGDMYAIVEGVKVPLAGNPDITKDGRIWRAYAPVAWSDMLDGVVTLEIIAPFDPYVAFDYALLDSNPIGTDSCCCDLEPVLEELEKAKQEREEITKKIESLSEQIENLTEYLKSRLDTGTVVTQEDLASGQGGVYFMGASKMSSE